MVLKKLAVAAAAFSFEWTTLSFAPPFTGSFELLHSIMASGFEQELSSVGLQVLAFRASGSVR